MRSLHVCIALTLAGPAVCEEPVNERVKSQFKSQLGRETYTVTWGTARTFNPGAELEIGETWGHGSVLEWLYFQPGQGGVDALSIRLDEGSQPYHSKWPPDNVPVVVKRAQMKLDAYAVLLRDLAVVDAAKLTPIREWNRVTMSSADFWVYARLKANQKTLIDLNWAGYMGSIDEPEYAKPRAAVALAREAVKGLDFKQHSLTEGERAWASAKFARDWKKFKDLDFHWFVRERYIMMIGVVGDSTALPTLRGILGVEPKSDDSSGKRCVYYAINAVTQLTKKDVRDKPVEEMDLEKTRRKVLDLLKDKK